MKRVVLILLLTAILTVCIFPIHAHLPVLIRCAGQPDPVELLSANQSEPVYFADGNLITPTIHQWSSGHMFFGSFQSGYGHSKTVVPRDLSEWIICRNDPVNLIDPDGMFSVWQWIKGIFSSEEEKNTNTNNKPSETVPVQNQMANKADEAQAAGIENLYTNPMMSNLADNLSTGFWPSPSGGRKVINGIEYTVHALDRMSPRGLIQVGNEIVSRGVTPSVVENAIKFGTKIPGNTANEIVHIFENVRVVTNPEATRVITVIVTGS